MKSLESGLYASLYCGFLFLIMLNGCGVRELSEDFDKDEIKKQVEVVIELINNRIPGFSKCVMYK